MKVKVCGMTQREDIEAAIEYGADAIGVNLYNGSSRYVGPDELPALVEDLPPLVQKVAVVVNFSLIDIQRLDEMFHFDVWQLHGDERADLCHWLKPRRLIKSFGLPFSGNQPELEEYDVEAFLLDRFSEQYGGTGKTFDWSLAVDFQKKTDRPIILSGGLKLDNVAKAFEVVKPYGVDVCTGVEASPGKKDRAKMKDFIQLCHSL
jgi:phosphoribosylanthranilate isomerase